MIQAGQSVTRQFLNDEFNPFLFAFIGTDRFGAPLSVVSALARLDLDAWAEAAMLSRMPREAAATKLSTRLSKFTEIPRIVQESGAIAARLVALLPNRVSADVRQVKPGPRCVSFGSASIASLIVLLLFLTVYYIRHQPQAPAPASATAQPMATPQPAPPKP